MVNFNSMFMGLQYPGFCGIKKGTGNHPTIPGDAKKNDSCENMPKTIDNPPEIPDNDDNLLRGGSGNEEEPNTVDNPPVIPDNDDLLIEENFFMRGYKP